MPAMRSVLSLPGAYRLFWTAIGGPRNIRRFIQQYVRPQPGCRVLDIGCGPGTIVPYLPGTEYVGFDVSPEYVESARKRFPHAKFVCARVSEYSEQESYFDVVLAMSILHHLDDAEALRLFHMARRALKPGGRLLTFDNVWTPDQSAAARYLISRDRGNFVRDEQGYVRLASQLFPRVTSSIRHDLLRIPYTHIIMECVRSA